MRYIYYIMKKIFSIALIFGVIFSCQQDEIEYSCDAEINRIVKENKLEYSQILVTDLTIYDIVLQKAIFRSWDADKKRNAWLEKLLYIQNTFELTNSEYEHIQKLVDHIDVDYFENDNIQNFQNSRAAFAEEWINYAINELGWTEKFIAFLVFRLYTTQSQFETELEFTNLEFEQYSMYPAPENCNCNTSADFCSYSDCQQNGCTTTSGCGWLWSEPCNGSC